MRGRSLVLGATIALLSGCMANQPISSAEIEPVGNQPDFSSPGSDLLAPQPLSQPTKIVVSSALKLESYSPLFLGEYLGEFEKENLQLEFVTLPAPEAFLALGQGAVDVAAVGITGAFFNAVASGAEFRLVLPAAAGSRDDGFWFSTEIVANGFPADRKIVIATPSGPSSPTMVPLSRYIKTLGLSVEMIEIVKIPAGEGGFPLERGLIDGAYLYSPEHLNLLTSGLAVRVAGFEAEQASTGYVFGSRLLSSSPELGDAFARALLRTVRNYLQDDYKANPEVLAALAEALGLTLEELQLTGSYYFPTRVDSDLFTDAQSIWLRYPDILNFKEILDGPVYIDERYATLTAQDQ